MWNSAITVNIVVLEYALVTTVSLHYAEFAKLAKYRFGCYYIPKYFAKQ